MLTDEQLRELLPETIKLEYPLINRDGERPQTFWLTDHLYVWLSNGEQIVIPAGFRTDFASVPGVAQGIFRSIGDHNLADVLHDYLYTVHVMSRADADREFLTYMRVLRPHSKSWLDNHLRWLAVRLGGRKAFAANGNLKTLSSIHTLKTVQEFPKLLILNRKTIAVINTSKKMLDSLATTSSGATVLSAVGTYMGGPEATGFIVISAIVSAVSLLVRTGLSYVSSITVIGNPIDPSLSQVGPVDPS